MRTIVHPVSGRSAVVGSRKRPAYNTRRLSLALYLTPKLPPPPDICDYSQRALQSLQQVYLNDRLGDCVVAGVAHMIGVWTGNAGKPSIFGDWAIKNAYAAFSGGEYPGADNGCSEEEALDVWVHTGFTPKYANPHKILCWVAVDASNPTEVKSALWLFEGLMSGLEMPDEWLAPMPDVDGFLLSAQGDPNPDNGHCMAHFSYDEQGLGTATWGLYGKTTWAAVEKYMRRRAGGALYAAVSLDQLIRATQKAPTGFDATQLLADARAIGFVHT